MLVVFSLIATFCQFSCSQESILGNNKDQVLGLESDNDSCVNLGIYDSIGVWHNRALIDYFTDDNVKIDTFGMFSRLHDHANEWVASRVQVDLLEFQDVVNTSPVSNYLQDAADIDIVLIDEIIETYGLSDSAESFLKKFNLEIQSLDYLANDAQDQRKIVIENYLIEAEFFCDGPIHDEFVIFTFLKIAYYSNQLWTIPDDIYGFRENLLQERTAGGAGGSMVLDPASPSGWSYCSGGGGGGGGGDPNSPWSSEFWRWRAAKYFMIDAAGATTAAATSLVASGGLSAAPNPALGGVPTAGAIAVIGGIGSSGGSVLNDVFSWNNP